MTVLKYISKQRYTINGMISYITDKNKSSLQNTILMSCSPETCIGEWCLTKICYDKCTPGHRLYHHFVIAPDSPCYDQISLDNFNEAILAIDSILNRWYDFRSQDYDRKTSKFHVISAIHADHKPMYHAHILVNSTSFVDGHEFPWNPRMFWLLLNIVNRILKYYHFSPIPNEMLNERSEIPSGDIDWR